MVSRSKLLNFRLYQLAEVWKAEEHDMSYCCQTRVGFTISEHLFRPSGDTEARQKGPRVPKTGKKGWPEESTRISGSSQWAFSACLSV